jgi:hypothetical protein
VLVRADAHLQRASPWLSSDARTDRILSPVAGTSCECPAVRSGRRELELHFAHVHRGTYAWCLGGVHRTEDLCAGLPQLKTCASTLYSGATGETNNLTPVIGVAPKHLPKLLISGNPNVASIQYVSTTTGNCPGKTKPPCARERCGPARVERFLSPRRTG